MSAYAKDGRVATVVGGDAFYLRPYALVGDGRVTHRVSRFGDGWAVQPVRETFPAAPTVFDTADEAIASVLELAMYGGTR